MNHPSPNQLRICAEIEEKNLAFEVSNFRGATEGSEDWQPSHHCSSGPFLAMMDGYLIRLKPLELMTDPLGRKNHNPNKLTAEQVGEGYRLLLEEEVDGRHSKIVQFWSTFTTHCWKLSLGGGDNIDRTYRIPTSTPYPPHKWAAEIEAFKRGEKVQFTPNQLLEWADHPREEPYWNDPTFKFRIAPKTRLVPLGPDDVPPGSVFKRHSRPDLRWINPLGVLSHAVSFQGTGVVEFKDLMEDWLIKRPGEEWQPCSKEVSE